jgi:hypothetical protein
LCAAVLAGEVELAAALAFAHVEHSRLETMPIVGALLGPSGTARMTARPRPSRP